MRSSWRSGAGRRRRRRVPSPGRSRQRSTIAASVPLSPRGEGEPGEVLNEFGEYEDEESYRQRGEDARVSILNKLVRIRRLYLKEISPSPGKRAAFQILTGLPVDWDKAAALEPQEFEPWLGRSQRDPDKILMAESGWSFGDVGYGPDKKAEMRRAIDQHREEEGLPPVGWED